MTLKNKTIQKLISFLIIFAMLTPAISLSLTPKQSQAQEEGGAGGEGGGGGGGGGNNVPVSDSEAQSLLQQISGNTVKTTLKTLKDWAIYLGKELLKTAAKRLLAKLTQEIVNWINSDFHGSPLFLENPESFFGDIAKSEIKNLVDLFGYDPNRFPFGRQFALNTIASYKRQLAENSQYTLSKVINDPDLLARYRSDFNVGGWNGFLINTQYPQNNYLGFQMTATEELARRLQGTVQTAAEKVQTQLQQGMGFLSPQVCPEGINPSYNNGYNEFNKPTYKPLTYKPLDPVYNSDVNSPEYLEEHADTPPEPINAEEIYYHEQQFKADDAAAKAEWAKTNTCLKADGTSGLVNTTPGSVAASHIMTALGSPLRSLELDAALGNSISAILDALIDHFIEKGLNALSDTIKPSSQTQDNWSYGGQTLDGRTITERVLNIPTSVSVRVGQTTSATISGGSGNFRIKTPPDALKATATIETSASTGSKLTVTGVAPITPSSTPRVTSVTIEDAYDSTIVPVTVIITINAIGALAVTPTNCISTDINNACITADTSIPIEATIDGGAGGYSIYTYPDEGIALATLSDSFLIVTGINRGNTFVTIKDSANAFKRVDIKIVAIVDLSLPQGILVPVNQTINVPISGGKEPYFVQSVVGSSATAKISTTNPRQLEIKGISTGNTGIIIRDSSATPKNASTNVTTFNQ